jgi:hypothetical protein
MSLSLLLETDIRDKVLKRAFGAAARVVAEQYFKDDGYLCILWRVQLSKIFVAPPCRARLVRYVSLPHQIKLGAKRHWTMRREPSAGMDDLRSVSLRDPSATSCEYSAIWLRQ